MLRRRLRKRVRHQSGADRAGADRRADQKGAARLVVLLHAEFLPQSRMAPTIRVMEESMRRFRLSGKRWASRTDLSFCGPTARIADRSPNALRRRRHVDVLDAEIGERID